MRTFRVFLGLFACALAQGAAAQSSQGLASIGSHNSRGLVVKAPTSAEVSVNRHASPTGSELLLFADTVTTSRSMRITHSKQLFIRSEVNSHWYRAVYGGTQFFVRRTDVALITTNATDE